jgi:hypothetical protein
LGSMGLCNFDSSIIVDDVTGSIHTIPSATYSCPWLVSELPFLVLRDDCLSVPVKVKVPSHQVGVKVVLLDVEGRGYFSLLVQLTLLEHRATVQVVDHISSLFVDKIASLIGWPAIFVSELTILVLCREYVALFISIKLSYYIAFVESS